MSNIQIVLCSIYKHIAQTKMIKVIHIESGSDVNALLLDYLSFTFGEHSKSTSNTLPFSH